MQMEISSIAVGGMKIEPKNQTRYISQSKI
jgi:hypothetical protein